MYNIDLADNMAALSDCLVSSTYRDSVSIIVPPPATRDAPKGGLIMCYLDELFYEIEN